jgi:hypothetical protein
VKEISEHLDKREDIIKQEVGKLVTRAASLPLLHFSISFLVSVYTVSTSFFFLDK